MEYISETSDTRQVIVVLAVVVSGGLVAEVLCQKQFIEAAVLYYRSSIVVVLYVMCWQWCFIRSRTVVEEIMQQQLYSCSSITKTSSSTVIALTLPLMLDNHWPTRWLGNARKKLCRSLIFFMSANFFFTITICNLFFNLQN